MSVWLDELSLLVQEVLFNPWVLAINITYWLSWNNFSNAWHVPKCVQSLKASFHISSLIVTISNILHFSQRKTRHASFDTLALQWITCSKASEAINSQQHSRFLHFFVMVFLGRHTDASPFFSVNSLVRVLVLASQSDQLPLKYLHAWDRIKLSSTVPAFPSLTHYFNT